MVNPNSVTHEMTDNQSERRSSLSIDEKALDKLESTLSPDVALDAEDKLYDHNGKEKVLETAEDFATALVSLEDDPTLPIHTFRMWFSGLGLAVFGAVLGMLFVSDNFPFTVTRPLRVNLSPFCSNSVHKLLPCLLFSCSCWFTCSAKYSNSSFRVLTVNGIMAMPFGILWTLAHSVCPVPSSSRILNLTSLNKKDIKEHAAAQIMANTAAGAATACFVFASDDLFYNITVNV